MSDRRAPTRCSVSRSVPAPGSAGTGGCPASHVPPSCAHGEKSLSTFLMQTFSCEQERTTSEHMHKHLCLQSSAHLAVIREMLSILAAVNIVLVCLAVTRELSLRETLRETLIFSDLMVSCCSLVRTVGLILTMRRRQGVA